MNNDVIETLKERGARYGVFADQAAISQQFEEVLRTTPKYKNLAPDQKEALKLILHKIARILNGDPNYADSWRDIAGYASLVERRLNGRTL